MYSTPATCISWCGGLTQGYLHQQSPLSWPRQEALRKTAWSLIRPIFSSMGKEIQPATQLYMAHFLDLQW
jgi:hypothetical protein